MNKLVEELRKKQGDKTLVEFANMLGVSPSYLSRIYSGERPIGLKMVSAIQRCFPDLGPFVNSFLVSDVPIGSRNGQTDTSA